MNIEEGQRWQHKKRGTLYTVVGVGTMQVSGDARFCVECGGQGLEGEDVVIYRGTDRLGFYEYWVRPLAEFTDGRFFLVDKLVAVGDAT